MADYFKNNVELKGNISYMEKIMTDRNGNDFQYVKVAQSENNKSKYYSIFLTGKMLEEFHERHYSIGSPLHLIGKLDSYMNKNKQTVFQIVPSEFIEIQKEKEYSEEKTLDV